jgi:hypothetical protein
LGLQVRLRWLQIPWLQVRLERLRGLWRLLWLLLALPLVIDATAVRQ